MRRLSDVLIAALLLVLGGFARALVPSARGARARVVRVHGRFGETLQYRVLRVWPRKGAWRWLNYLPVMWRVLDGSLSVVGSRPVLALRALPEAAAFVACPGLLSPYLVQRRGVFAGADRARSDREFLRGLSFRRYVGVVLRFLAVLVMPPRPPRAQQRVSLLGVDIANETLDGAVEQVAAMAVGQRARHVAFVNADCFNIAARHAAYRRILGEASMVLADGIGVRLALDWFVGTRLRDNVNGTDMFPRLCRVAAERALPIFFLGGQPGVADAVAANALKRFPGMRIAGACDGFFAADDAEAVVRQINTSGASILLVAMGAPRQDEWIARHLAQLDVGVAIGVGGLFDFYSGRIARAPVWMREVGLEWVYRLMQEPGRMWRRYVVGNPLFLWRAWRGARQAGVLVQARGLQP